MAQLFDPLTIKDVTLRNRIGVAPMCQYSSIDGFATDWHIVHLGSRAVGGAGLIIAEATAVSPEGRITPGDAGIWHDDHIDGLRRVNRFVKQYGAVPAIQLAHAGRKAGAARPWEGGHHLQDSEGGWQAIGPTAESFGGRLPRVPEAMTLEDIKRIQYAFRDAAARSLEADYQIIEIHGAHGYLHHSFLSPLVNTRTDEYGGSFENRTRFMRETVELVQEVWPDHLPLGVRFSATDWDSEGWRVEDSVRLATILREMGVDFIDCSSGGASNQSKTALGGATQDQIALAEVVRRDANMITMAVGGITDPTQANEIIAQGQADVALLGRDFLRDPYWPMHAAQALGVDTKPVIPSQLHFWVGS